MSPTIILVRHAQALHNVDKDYSLHDPELSELGRQQCAELKANLVPRIPKDLDVGLIIVSPMKRTIETALLAFGELIERGIPIVAHAGWQETPSNPATRDLPSSLLHPSSLKSHSHTAILSTRTKSLPPPLPYTATPARLSSHVASESCANCTADRRRPSSSSRTRGFSGLASRGGGL
ncbi:hypothetical protein VTI74DRAFT_10031 [Chaetomium olivicolor]